MARRDLQNKVFPGGIYNKFNVITLRTGSATVVMNDNRTGQNNGAIAPNTVIDRFQNEPPVERSRNDSTKDSDV